MQHEKQASAVSRLAEQCFFVHVGRCAAKPIKKPPTPLATRGWGVS